MLNAIAVILGLALCFIAIWMFGIVTKTERAAVKASNELNGPIKVRSIYSANLHLWKRVRVVVPLCSLLGLPLIWGGLLSANLTGFLAITAFAVVGLISIVVALNLFGVVFRALSKGGDWNQEYSNVEPGRRVFFMPSGEDWGQEYSNKEAHSYSELEPSVRDETKNMLKRDPFKKQKNALRDKIKNLFKRDPIKGQVTALLKTLPKSKRQEIEKHLYKGEFGSVFNAKDSPETLSILFKVYATALHLSDEEPRRRAISGFHSISRYIQFPAHLHKDSPYLSPFYQSVPIALKGNEHTITTALLYCLSDGALDLKYRLICASTLARMRAQNAIGSIRSLISSVENVDLHSLGNLLETCHIFGLPEGKRWAYQAIDAYSKYESEMGSGSAKQAFEFAIPFLMEHFDNEVTDRVIELLNTSIEKIKSTGSSLISTPARHILDLATGQKLDNFIPNNKIEMLKVGH